MAWEISQEHSNEWEGTIRRHPERWTTHLWTEVYNFPKEGRGWPSWTNKLALSKFSALVNSKDGYAVADCEDPREQRVLEFVVLSLYLEKPTRTTVTISNTIFGVLSGVRPISLGVVI